MGVGSLVANCICMYLINLSIIKKLEEVAKGVFFGGFFWWVSWTVRLDVGINILSFQGELSISTGRSIL